MIEGNHSVEDNHILFLSLSGNDDPKGNDE
jgi:hypothetical protein